MKGRKPLPTEVKRARGTLQPCRTRTDEMRPELVRDMPEPPEYLDEYGRAEWERILPELKASGVLARLDLSIIAMYCNEIATYIECQQQMKKAATRVMVIKDDSGKVKYAQQLPYQKIANDALEKAVKIAAEFGFTPAARTRIGVGGTEKPKSAIFDLMKPVVTKKVI